MCVPVRLMEAELRADISRWLYTEGLERLLVRSEESIEEKGVRKRGRRKCPRIYASEGESPQIPRPRVSKPPWVNAATLLASIDRLFVTRRGMRNRPMRHGGPP